VAKKAAFAISIARVIMGIVLGMSMQMHPSLVAKKASFTMSITTVITVT